MDYRAFPTYELYSPGSLLAIFLPILLVIALACVHAFLTMKLAAAKGYAGYFWTGFFLQTIGLLYVIGLPMAKDNARYSSPS